MSFFAVLRGVLCLEACIFFRKELRFSGDDPRFLTGFQGPMHWVRKLQLFTKKKRQASKHKIPLKMAKNYAFSPKQSGLKTTSGEFLGMYELDFSCSSIFHQVTANIRHFKGKKFQLIFHPVFALFHCQANFRKL